MNVDVVEAPPIEPWVLVVALLAPTIFWVGYTYYKDRIRPEPFGPIGITYLLGIAAAFVGYEIYIVAEWLGMPEAYVLAETNRPWFFVYVVGFVGVVEELIKAVPFVLVVRRLKHFDEDIDGIVYASVIALGYATYENFFFLPYLEGPARWGRAFASPLVHMMFSSIWGFAIAKAHLRGESIVRPALISLGIAAAVHGLYDFVSTDPILAPASSLAIGVVWVWRIRLIAKLHKVELARRAEGESEGQAPADP